ncbi:MAG: TolB family protein [Chloroflexota bacterium]
MFGKQPASRPIFNRRRQRSRFPWVWILLGLVALLFFLVPTNTQPIVNLDQVTPFVVEITPRPTPTFTPRPVSEHGGRIVYTCTRGEYNQLCLINADGSDPQQLSSGIGANDYYPIFSPDGKALMFASNRNGAFDIYLMVFGQRDLFQITTNVGNVISPSFSPDGSRVVFANQAGDAPPALWMANLDGSDPHLVYAGPGAIVAAAWSPDGQTIAYAMETALAGQYQVYLMNVDGTASRQLTNIEGVGGSLSWSPDGQFLLIYAGPVGGREIFRLDAATGALTQLTNGGNNASPCYSPDGQFIVFNSLRNNGQADLYIINADGSNLRQLTTDPEPDWQPSWGP